MIRILKSAQVPEVLSTKGVKETKANKALYEAEPNAYNAGTKKFEIKKSIYGAKTVKTKAISDQFKKCCFCEAKFTANGSGDIEHFRPKGGYTQARNETELTIPGYYWLAYDWNNLYFSCELCNRSYKKNYFPLKAESLRAKNHLADIEKEEPLLLHPGLDNPTEHITFRRHVPVALTKRGEESIFGYGLDRDDMNEARAEFMEMFVALETYSRLPIDSMSVEEKKVEAARLRKTLPEFEEFVQASKALVRKAANRDRPYSSMVQAYFREEGIDPAQV